MKDIFDGMIITILLVVMIFTIIGITKYDDKAHDRAISWAEEIQKDHLYSGKTYVEMVIPGIYKIEHENGRLDDLTGKGVDDRDFYISSFVDLEMDDIVAFINN